MNTPVMHRQIERGFARLVMGVPWLFGFAEGGLETWMFVALGLSILLLGQWGHPQAAFKPGSLVLEGLGVSALMLGTAGFAEWGWMPQLALACLEGAAVWWSSKT